MRKGFVTGAAIGLLLTAGGAGAATFDLAKMSGGERIAFLEAKTDFREQRPEGSDRTKVKGMTFQQVADQAAKDAR